MPPLQDAPILGIDTATAEGRVALFWPTAGRIEEQNLSPETRSSKTLLAALADLFHSTRTGKETIAAIGVALGPGSFTSLRVGLSTAKGLSLGLGCPIHGISSLEAMAYAALARLEERGEPSPEWILPFRDAWHGEVFTACFGPRPPRGGGRFRGWPRRGGDSVGRPEAIPVPETGTILLAGAKEYPARPAIEAAAGPRGRFLDVQTSAAAVARLTHEAILAGENPASHDLSPIYGRKPRAETQWIRSDA